MFGEAHQKDISSVMTFLWKNDLAHNKWAILAKAYSIIRDAQGKDLSPTEGFLELNAPFVNVPRPGEYLHLMGWVICNDKDASISRENAVNKDILETRHSVHDVVQNSIRSGYVFCKSLSQTQFDLMMVMAGGK